MFPRGIYWTRWSQLEIWRWGFLLRFLWLRLRIDFRRAIV
jgi:hypothetical protein